MDFKHAIIVYAVGSFFLGVFGGLLGFVVQLSVLFGISPQTAFLAAVVLSVLLILVAIVLFLWFVILAVKDIKSKNETMLWLLLVVFAGWIGGLIYYLVTKDKTRKAVQPS